MRNIYFLFLVFVALMSCKSDFSFDDNSIPTPPPTPQIIKYNFGNDKTADFHGLILDIAGKPIPNVSVTIGSSSALTSEKGFFSLRNVPVKENFAYIKSSKQGFINGSKIIVPNSGSNEVNIMMIEDNVTSTFTAGSANTVSLQDGTKIKFDGGFKDLNGNNYNGNVNVKVFSLATSNKYLREIMPGSFLANDKDGNAKVLKTYGMVKVKLTDNLGNKLQIADGHKAEITFPIDPTQVASSPNEIPLWYFDEESGFWKEEGKAIKSGNSYVGYVSHFTWWNFDSPFGYCRLNVKAVDENNQPLNKIQLYIKQNDIKRVEYTNSEGVASGIIPAKETLSLIAYNDCGNVIFTKDIGPYEASSENNLTITISTNLLKKYKITGQLNDCSNNPVNNGVVYLKNSNSPNYFQYDRAVTSQDGNFSIDTYLCSQIPNFIILGDDQLNFKTTGELKFTATSQNFNIGSIVACDTINEYARYQIDNNPEIIITENPTLEMTNGFIFIGNGASKIFGYSGSRLVIGNQPFAFNMRFTDNNMVVYNISKDGNYTRGNVLFNLINDAPIVSSYIDFTFDGSYPDNLGVNHTIKGRVHVRRRY